MSTLQNEIAPLVGFMQRLTHALQNLAYLATPDEIYCISRLLDLATQEVNLAAARNTLKQQQQQQALIPYLFLLLRRPESPLFQNHPSLVYFNQTQTHHEITISPSTSPVPSSPSRCYSSDGNNSQPSSPVSSLFPSNDNNSSAPGSPETPKRTKSSPGKVLTTRARCSGATEPETEDLGNLHEVVSKVISRHRRDRKCKKGFKKVQLTCSWCYCTESPEWRKGPLDIPLCNACGIQYKKQLKKEQEARKEEELKLHREKRDDRAGIGHSIDSLLN